MLNRLSTNKAIWTQNAERVNKCMLLAAREQFRKKCGEGQQVITNGQMLQQMHVKTDLVELGMYFCSQCEHTVANQSIGRSHASLQGSNLLKMILIFCRTRLKSWLW